MPTENAIHCIELNSGKNFTGDLILAENGLSVEFHGYDSVPPLDLVEPIYVRTSNNKLASLFGTFYAGSQGYGDVRSNQFIRIAKYQANTVILGEEKWLPEHRVKRVTFYAPLANSVLYDSDVVEKLRTDLFSYYENSLLFEQPGIGWKISLKYNYTVRPCTLEGTHFRPNFSIEFDEPVTLERYIDLVHRCLTFLSFVSAKRFLPST